MSFRFYRLRFLAVAILLEALCLPAFPATPQFSRQVRVGLRSGDQWEPAIAADGYGHVYILYPQYVQVPGCETCPVPTMILVESGDNGTTWKSERRIASRGSAQFDPQIVVDPVDRRTVYAAWLENDKRDIAVARSVDFGLTWTIVVATRTETEADKPVLAVRGLDVYVSYNRAAKIWVAASHDGGNTFAPVNVNPTDGMGWAQAGGATIDAAGNVFLSWAGYSRSAEGQGPVSLYVSRSLNGGKDWTTALLDVSGAPPECATDECGWAYLGAQIALTSDAAGTLYALWNAGPVSKGSERVYFSSSTDPAGFKFPFGDYFEMDIDNHGDTQVVWGEGLTYESPGSIWYSNGR